MPGTSGAGARRTALPDAFILNRTTGDVLARRVVLCDNFFSRGRGLMFRRPLAEDEVYLFVLGRESRLDAAIHMFFVSFPIAVVWLDASRWVVHTVLARPWWPYYAPPRPARYFLEGHPVLLDRVKVGDEIGLDVLKPGA
jgi:uncharacterized membrane protein (UPF0127 family)